MEEFAPAGFHEGLEGGGGLGLAGVVVDEVEDFRGVVGEGGVVGGRCGGERSRWGMLMW